MEIVEQTITIIISGIGLKVNLIWGGIKAINFDTLLLSANDKFVLKLAVAVKVAVKNLFSFLKIINHDDSFYT